MYRTAIEKMKKWKESRFRKPLIIEGARQVGKTWLMKEFLPERLEIRRQWKNRQESYVHLTKNQVHH